MAQVRVTKPPVEVASAEVQEPAAPKDAVKPDTIISSVVAERPVVQESVEQAIPAPPPVSAVIEVPDVDLNSEDIVEVSEPADSTVSTELESDIQTSDVAVSAEPDVSPKGESDPLVIELRAKSYSWIQVRDGDELLLTRLLREGEVYRVPNRAGLTLMTGNAGGLEVFVGGKLMPPVR